MSAIADKTLWDSCGNKCRIELYCIGNGVFELYVHQFNSAIPDRFTGPIGDLNNRADLWIAARKAEGFMEQLPSYNPDFRHV